MRNRLYIFVQNNSIVDTVYFILGGTYDCLTVSAAKFGCLIKTMIAKSPGIKIHFSLVSRAKQWNDLGGLI